MGRGAVSCWRTYRRDPTFLLGGYRRDSTSGWRAYRRDPIFRWLAYRRARAEYSSIWASRSHGYETSTSWIAPASSRTGDSRGITKAEYDGNRRASTRATTSSRRAGSKCTPYDSVSARAAG